MPAATASRDRTTAGMLVPSARGRHGLHGGGRPLAPVTMDMRTPPSAGVDIRRSTRSWV